MFGQKAKLLDLRGVAVCGDVVSSSLGFLYVSGVCDLFG